MSPEQAKRLREANMRAMAVRERIRRLAHNSKQSWLAEALKKISRRLFSA